MASRTIDVKSVAGGPVHSDLQEMRQPFAISAAFHLALLLFAIFGLNLLPSKTIVMPPPISVSMVKPSDIARTNHVDDAHEEKEEKPPEPSKAPEPPKESSQSTPPPPPPPPVEKIEQPAPPPPKPPEPQKPPEPMEKPLPKMAPVQQAQSSFQQPAQLPPLQKPLQVAKQPPPPKPQPKTKPVDDDFNNLLTSLTPPVPKADQITKDKPVKGHQQNAARAQASDELTADEMARVRQQLAGCWVIPAGAMSADQLVVEVQTEFNQDRTLRNAQLVDTARYNSDPFYRAAADSVLRALRNPACNPLDLPPDKYDEWHTMTITFNPKEMLGL